MKTIKCPKCGSKETAICEEYADWGTRTTYCCANCGYNWYKDEADAKADTGKPQLHLITPEILYGISKIREYGTQKYGDPENWRKVEPIRYWDACLRHCLAAVGDPLKKDPESGYPHIWHAACNLMFLCSLLWEELSE